MKITFSHAKKKVEVMLEGESQCKLYAVPTEYSFDGYFASLWAQGELEPLPACDVVKASLLAHVEAKLVDGAYQTIDHFLTKGVSYATGE